jgi:SAM-dependent methyltransferase
MVCLDIAGGALGRLDELGAGWVSGVRGDIEALPLRPGSFDRIIVASVLQWTADPLEVVSRCVELLRPGGQLLFSVFLAEYLRELDETRWRVSGSRLPIRLVDRLELLAVLEQAGLALVWEEHLHEVLYFPTALFALCRAYEKRYRTTRGVPATCDTLVGIAQRR